MSVTHFNFSKKNGNRYLFSFEWLAFKIFVFPMTTGAFGGKIQTYWILRFDGTCQFYCPFGRDNEWGAIFHYFYPKKGGLFQLCCEIEVFFQKNYFFFYTCLLLFLVLTIVIWTTKLNWWSSTVYTLYTQSTDLRSVERNSFLAFFLNHK